MNGFFVLGHIAFFKKVVESSHDPGFVFRRQGFVGAVPIRQHAQPFEFPPLNIDPVSRVAGGFLSERHAADLAFVPALFLHELVLNGKAVAIPSGDIGRPEPAEGFVFHDDVFKDFVQRMTHVNGAVGVRRAVVENEGSPGGVSFLNFLVHLKFFPQRERGGFPQRQVRFHGKGGLGQLNVVFGFHGTSILAKWSPLGIPGLPFVAVLLKLHSCDK